MSLLLQRRWFASKPFRTAMTIGKRSKSFRRLQEQKSAARWKRKASLPPPSNHPNPVKLPRSRFPRNRLPPLRMKIGIGPIPKNDSLCAPPIQCIKLPPSPNSRQNRRMKRSCPQFPLFPLFLLFLPWIGHRMKRLWILHNAMEHKNTMKHNSNETDSKLNESGNTNFKHETQSNLPHPSTVSTVSTVSTNASNSPSSSEGRRGRRSRGLAAEGGRSPAGTASSGVSMAGKASTASGGGKRGSKPAVSWTGLEDETLQVLAQTFQFNWDAIAKSRRAERKGMMGRNGV